MKYTLRNYQKQASDAAVRLFTSKADKNGFGYPAYGCRKELGDSRYRLSSGRAAVSIST